MRWIKNKETKSNQIKSNQVKSTSVQAFTFLHCLENLKLKNWKIPKIKPFQINRIDAHRKCFNYFEGDNKLRYEKKKILSSINLDHVMKYEILREKQKLVLNCKANLYLKIEVEIEKKVEFLL